MARRLCLHPAARWLMPDKRCRSRWLWLRWSDIRNIPTMCGRVMGMILPPFLQCSITSCIQFLPPVQMHILHNIAAKTVNAKFFHPRSNPCNQILRRRQVSILAQSPGRRVYPRVIGFALPLPFFLQEVGYFHRHHALVLEIGHSVKRGLKRIVFIPSFIRHTNPAAVIPSLPAKSPL